MIVVAYIYVFGSGLLGTFLFQFLIQDSSFPRGWIIFMELYPGFSLYRGLYEFAQFAFQGNLRGADGMKWKDFSDSAMDEVFYIIIVEWFLALIAAYYIDKIVSSGKDPLFFLKTPFKKSPSMRKPSLQRQGSKVFVEMEKPDVTQEIEKVEKLMLEDSTSHAIVCDNLKKVYPGRDGNPPKMAVRGLSLAVPSGECFGMLGPNGAGKTSFINMMTGLLKPTSGTGLVQGLDICSDMGRVYTSMGVCPQHDLLWETLTGREHLLFYGRLKNLKGSDLTQAVEESLRSVNLFHGGVGDKPAGKYSGGMKRRLSVAISLIGNPKVVYMDEPSTGLDPASRKNLWTVIKRAKQNTAIILTTHSMEEAEFLCDRLGIFVDGSLQCIGNPKELKGRYGGSYVFTMTTSSEHEGDVEKLIQDVSPNAKKIYHIAGTQKFELPKEDVRISEVFQAVEKAKSNLLGSSAFRGGAGDGGGGGGDVDSQPRDMDQMLSRIRQQLAGAPSERQNLMKPFVNKRSDQNLEAFSERLRAAGGENSVGPAWISDGVQLKTPLSSSSFSQLILKRAMKGKGVVGKNQEAPPPESPIAHDPLAVKPIPKGNGVVSHGEGNHTNSSSCGISLREFIRSSYGKREKRHSLSLFRQLVELIGSAHSQGLFLLELRPSLFALVPSKKLRYNGTFGKSSIESDGDEDLNRKRHVVQESSLVGRDLKKRRMDLNAPGNQLQATSSGRPLKRKSPLIDLNVVDVRNPDSCELQQQSYMKNLGVPSVTRKQSMSTWLEEQWYTCPEEINGEDIGEKSNIYSLGVLLFELLCHCESSEMHAAMMADLRHRILPPAFLSRYPKEAGFCLWLLHPEPSSRPTAREILKSELICVEDSVKSTAADEEISELLLHFLSSLEKQKKKNASKLLQDIQTLEDDIKEAERRYSSRASLVRSHEATERKVQSSPIGEGSTTTSGALFVPTANTDRLMSNIRQLEDAYFIMRSQMKLSDSTASARSDKSLLKDKWSENQNKDQDARTKGKSSDQLEVFFEGLCKFARYSKFETCGTIRSGDLLNSASVVCSLSFDPDEEHIAAAGISKKIKIFDFNAFMNESVGVHYPLVEMVNKSKLSCVCWNSYIKNYLASTDYDGVVQIWDAGTGQGFSQYTEHQKRAWSVDFSPSDPTKFVSGSDDCSVKLWSVNEKRSLGTIWSPANVCCVQFSSYSNHLLAFGSADYKVYCYDLRYVKTPWCTLAGHEKAVSYVKFMDSETIVTASTDNSLKLWNLNKTNSSGLSPGACSMTYKGHTNQKNFVGLSVLDGYIACGSETNEVYSYYRSLPMPMTSYKFGSVDPISGNEYFDDNGQFVSSVCWRKKSNMLVAANSTGNMKLLKLV